MNIYFDAQDINNIFFIYLMIFAAFTPFRFAPKISNLSAYRCGYRVRTLCMLHSAQINATRQGILDSQCDVLNTDAAITIALASYTAPEGAKRAISLVKLGAGAGAVNHKNESVATGRFTGYNNHQYFSVAIGRRAGNLKQGHNNADTLVSGVDSAR